MSAKKTRVFVKKSGRLTEICNSFQKDSTAEGAKLLKNRNSMPIYSIEKSSPARRAELIDSFNDSEAGHYVTQFVGLCLLGRWEEVVKDLGFYYVALSDYESTTAADECFKRYSLGLCSEEERRWADQVSKRTDLDFKRLLKFYREKFPPTSHKISEFLSHRECLEVEKHERRKEEDRQPNLKDLEKAQEMHGKLNAEMLRLAYNKHIEEAKRYIDDCKEGGLPANLSSIRQLQHILEDILRNSDDVLLTKKATIFYSVLEDMANN